MDDYMRLLKAIAYIVYERLCSDQWIEDCEDLAELLDEAI